MLIQPTGWTTFITLWRKYSSASRELTLQIDSAPFTTTWRILRKDLGLKAYCSRTKFCLAIRLISSSVVTWTSNFVVLKLISSPKRFKSCHYTQIKQRFDVVYGPLLGGNDSYVCSAYYALVLVRIPLNFHVGIRECPQMRTPMPM